MPLSFDANYYAQFRPDVFNAYLSTGSKTGQTWAQFAENHYNNFGWKEGSNPNSVFNTIDYLKANADVLNAGVNPFQHFLKFGATEGRAPSATFPVTFASFDSAKYLAANPDLATAGITTKAQAWAHFVIYGEFEGRPGAPAIDTSLPGSTFTLTANLDNLTGTAGKDLFVADQNTLSTDVINGGQGVDTLKVVTTNAAAFTAAPILTSVETVSVSTLGGNPVTINLDATVDQPKTLIDTLSNSAVTFDQVGAIADVQATTIVTPSALTVNYTAATVAGTADVQKLTLDNAALTTFTDNGIETLNVTASTTSSIATITDAQLKTLNIDGAGNLTLGTTTGLTATTIDGSKSTGNLSLTLGAADQTIKGGTGNDTFTFGANFTSKDIVDGGTGANTVSLAGGDYSASTNDVLKGLNALTNIQTISFNGATGATIDHSTFTNATATTLAFAGAGNDTVNNAISGETYAFTNGNGGTATFTMKTGVSTLNLALKGVDDTATTAAGAHVDADVGNLNTGTANTVNIVSSGSTSFASTIAGNVNEIGTITAAANATINLSGNAHTSIAGLANQAIVQAGTLTGDLIVSGSAGNDVITGGAGVNKITGGAGLDTIDISASAAKIDTIFLNGIVAEANRDTITGFKVGVGGDLIDLNAVDTTAGTAANATIAIQNVTANAGSTTFLTGTNDLMSLSFAASGNGLAGSADGTALLASVGTLKVANDNDKGYIVAYQGGNAFLYFVSDASGDSNLTAAEIHLVGTINGAAVGSVTADNFHLS